VVRLAAEREGLASTGEDRTSGRCRAPPWLLPSRPGVFLASALVAATAVAVPARPCGGLRSRSTRSSSSGRVPVATTPASSTSPRPPAARPVRVRPSHPPVAAALPARGARPLVGRHTVRVRPRAALPLGERPGDAHLAVPAAGPRRTRALVLLVSAFLRSVGAPLAGVLAAALLGSSRRSSPTAHRLQRPPARRALPGHAVGRRRGHPPSLARRRRFRRPPRGRRPGTKYSAVTLLPAIAVLVALEAVTRGGTDWRRRLVVAAASATASGYLALVALFRGEWSLDHLVLAST